MTNMDMKETIQEVYDVRPSTAHYIERVLDDIVRISNQEYARGREDALENVKNSVLDTAIELLEEELINLDDEVLRLLRMSEGTKGFNAGIKKAISILKRERGQ